MQHESILEHISRHGEKEHQLRQPHYSPSQRDSWRPPETLREVYLATHTGRIEAAKFET